MLLSGEGGGGRRGGLLFGASLPRGSAPGGSARLSQLIFVLGAVVLLAGVHNVWVTHLVARCFRHASGSPGALSSGGGGGGGGDAQVSSHGGPRPPSRLGLVRGGVHIVGGGAPVHAVASASPSPAAAEAELSALAAATRLLALLQPANRELLALAAGEGAGAPERLPTYTREFAAALAREVMAVPAPAVAPRRVEKAAAAAAAEAAAEAVPEAEAPGDDPAHAPLGRAGDGSSGAGSLPYPWPSERYHTQQTCYVQSDESELCVYDNVLCTDGINAFVVADAASDLAEGPGGAEGAEELRRGLAGGAAGGPLLRSLLAALPGGRAGPEGAEEAAADAALAALLAGVAAGGSELSAGEALLGALVNASDPRAPPRWLRDPHAHCWDGRYGEGWVGACGPAACVPAAGAVEWLR